MTQEIAVIEGIETRELFTAKTLDTAITKIETDIRSIHTDISTKKGRDDVISLSVKVRDSKTLVEKVRKKLGEDLREELDGINSVGKEAVTRLQNLQDEVRLPVTEFENAEKERVDNHKMMISEIVETSILEGNDIITVEVIENAIKQAYDLYSNREWEEFTQKAQETHEEVTQILSEKLIALKTHLAEQAELEQLRADKAIQDQKDRDAQIAKDAKTQADGEAKILLDKIKADKAKAIQGKKDAVAKAKQDIKDFDARTKKAAEDADIAQQKAVDDERQRIADEKQAEIDAEAKRALNTKHKDGINNEALPALIHTLNKEGTPEDHAKEIIIAIATGQVPHISIKY